jgi:hypothetical protein
VPDEERRGGFQDFCMGRRLWSEERQGEKSRTIKMSG